MSGLFRKLSILNYPFSIFSNRRHRRIAIEPNPHHIHAVFERSGSTLFSQSSALPLTVWRWPTSTWMQRRIAAIKK